MKVIKSIEKMSDWSRTQRQAGQIIGLVPTMGFLHEGHLSLIRTAKKQSQKVVVSIYVNPTQFGPGEDLQQYPRDFERDELLCRTEGVDAIFYPNDETMYPPGYKTYIEVEELSHALCGVSRPNHFRGVATICCKLFNIIQPHLSVFGQKDAQQTIILKQMVRDLNIDTRLIIEPIVRESDGLAMSSRNKYLSNEERREAIILHQALQFAENELLKGNFDFGGIQSAMRTLITEQSSGRIDYIEFKNAQNLLEPDPKNQDTLIALAVYFNRTRLIDNIILSALDKT